MLKRLWRLLEPRDRRRVLWVLPLLVVSAGFEVIGVAAVVPFISLLADPTSLGSVPWIGPLVEARGIEDSMAIVRGLGIVLAVALVSANALVIATNLWVLRFTWSLNHRLSARLLRHYLGQPYAFTLTRNTAELANKVLAETRQLMENGVQSWLEVFTRTVVITALVGFLVVLDPTLALVAFGVLGLAYAGIFTLSRRYLRRIGRESVQVGAARLKAVNEALGAFKDLKVTGREASAFIQYDRPAQRYGEVEAAHRAIAKLPRYALEAVAVGGMVITATLMADRGGSFTGTLPVLVAYAFAGMRLMPLMQQLFSAIARSRFAEGSLEALEADFLQMDPGEGDLDGAPEPMPFDRTIELRDVRFTYPGAVEPVLDGVTLEIPKHRSVALVGHSGSGKTTTVDVLLGLLVPQEGEVSVDGILVTPELRRAYRRLFGYVPQEVYLVDDTISRNVALGVLPEDVDPEAVRRACTLAQIATFVEKELPDGYDTWVGERGVRLSGGQRQRIGIARALYHQPQVLVFDEATSALDVHTERHLYDALDAIARTHTVVTIAHRLETVAKADTVIVLEGGRVIDRGPPATVLDRYRLAVPESTVASP